MIFNDMASLLVDEKEAGRGGDYARSVGAAVDSGSSASSKPRHLRQFGRRCGLAFGAGAGIGCKSFHAYPRSLVESRIAEVEWLADMAFGPVPKELKI
jgi:hypothetical protein